MPKELNCQGNENFGGFRKSFKRQEGKALTLKGIIVLRWVLRLGILKIVLLMAYLLIFG